MQNLLETFLAKRGQFLSVTWKRPAKVYQGVNDLIEKKVKAINVRAGVDYDARASVQDKRESGDLPVVNAGLSGMVWAKNDKGESLFPHVLESIKTGERSFRFDVLSNSNFETQWLLNGLPVEKSQIESFLQASERRDNSRQLDCLNVKESAILEMD